MNSYGQIMGQALAQASFEAKEDGLDAEPNGAADDVRMSSNPDYKPQGEVMIEIPIELRDSEELKELRASLESKGFVTHCRERTEYSVEENHPGDVTDPAVHERQGLIENAVMNGIHNTYSDNDLFKVVQLVRPEDTVKGANSDIVFLMNDNGEVHEYLASQGHTVTNNVDELGRILLKDEKPDQ